MEEHFEGPPQFEGPPLIAATPVDMNVAAMLEPTEIRQILQDLFVGQQRLTQELQQVRADLSQGQGLLMEEVRSLRQFVHTTSALPHVGGNTGKRVSTMEHLAEQFTTGIQDIASAGAAIWSHSSTAQYKHTKVPHDHRQSSASRVTVYNSMAGCSPVPFEGHASENIGSSHASSRRARSKGHLKQDSAKHDLPMTGPRVQHFQQRVGAVVTAHNVAGFMHNRLQEPGRHKDTCFRVSIHSPSSQSRISETSAWTSKPHEGNTSRSNGHASVVTSLDAVSGAAGNSGTGEASTANPDFPDAQGKKPASELEMALGALRSSEDAGFNVNHHLESCRVY